MTRATRRIQRHRRGELDSPAALELHLARRLDLRGLVVQALDLRELDLQEVAVDDAIFLGCQFRDREQESGLVARGAAVFPRLRGLPYDPYRGALYTVDELLDGWNAGGYTATLDFRIYAHFDRERRHPAGVSLRESLAQRIHDHAIDDALEEMLVDAAGRGVVGVMGGHGTPRSDPSYLEVARLAWRLTRAGYLVASGGGPGVMEAANLGAFFANYADEAVLEAVVAELSQADRFDGGEEEGTPAYLQAIRDYFECGRRALSTFAGPTAAPALAERYRLEAVEPGRSLAVPTWFYGHEPTNLFASHVAKYFSNSLREDGLLALATAGVVYAPGSAGTLQEVFMDLAQNHYATFEVRSPMVFLGRERYAEVFRLLQAFVRARGMQEVYGDMLAITDQAAEAVTFIQAHPPRPREDRVPLYDLMQGAP